MLSKVVIKRLHNLESSMDYNHKITSEYEGFEKINQEPIDKYMIYSFKNTFKAHKMLKINSKLGRN